MWSGGDEASLASRATPYDCGVAKRPSLPIVRAAAPISLRAVPSRHLDGTLVVEVVDGAAADVAVVHHSVAPPAAGERADLAVDERVVVDQPVAHLVVEVDGLVRRDLGTTYTRNLDGWPE